MALQRLRAISRDVALIGGGIDRFRATSAFGWSERDQFRPRCLPKSALIWRLLRACRTDMFMGHKFNRRVPAPIWAAHTFGRAAPRRGNVTPTLWAIWARRRQRPLGGSACTGLSGYSACCSAIVECHAQVIAPFRGQSRSPESVQEIWSAWSAQTRRRIRLTSASCLPYRPARAPCADLDSELVPESPWRRAVVPIAALWKAI